MKISVQNKGQNIQALVRQCGYAPSSNRHGEPSFVRRAGSGEFPRFHIYIDETPTDFIINLHLDQKKPSYEGTRAHGGEHEGPAVDAEISRLRGILV